MCIVCASARCRLCALSCFLACVADYLVHATKCIRQNCVGTAGPSLMLQVWHRMLGARTHVRATTGLYTVAGARFQTCYISLPALVSVYPAKWEQTCGFGELSACCRQKLLQWSLLCGTTYFSAHGDSQRPAEQILPLVSLWGMCMYLSFESANIYIYIYNARRY